MIRSIQLLNWMESYIASYIHKEYILWQKVVAIAVAIAVGASEQF